MTSWRWFWVIVLLLGGISAVVQQKQVGSLVLALIIIAVIVHTRPNKGGKK